MITARAEMVVGPNGRLRQAGTMDGDGRFVSDLRDLCERSLFHFAFIVLSRDYLTASLHLPICNWLRKTPPYRKLLLLPRRHAKTSIVSHALPLHILIQPMGGPYMPHKLGCDMRILLAGETETRARDNMRVIRDVFENNTIFRALWPELCWENPRREAPQWNEKALVVPRTTAFPDPSMRAIGVGGAIVGARHDVHIKDDLVGEEAANSELVMQNTIQWTINSRALFDDPDRSLEYTIGTRWAVSDLYQHILDHDPTVDYVMRSIIEDGRPIYPEVFSLETIARLEREFGVMFALLYMNQVGDPSLVDFAASQLRFFSLEGTSLLDFAGDVRDQELLERLRPPPLQEILPRGERLTVGRIEQLGRLDVRETYLRMKGT